MGPKMQGQYSWEETYQGTQVQTVYKGKGAREKEMFRGMNRANSHKLHPCQQKPKKNVQRKNHLLCSLGSYVTKVNQ